MPDYNLGRAHGDIEIGYDGRGLRAAQADMAATSVEAAALDTSMGRVNRSFDENRKQTSLSAEAIVRHRGQVEDLRRTYQRYHDEHERGARRVAEAEAKLRQAVQSGLDDDKVATRLIRDVVKAREDEQRLLARSEQAYSRYHTRLAAVGQEVERFNRVHISATTGMSRMRHEAEQLGDALERMSSMLGTIARTVGTGGLMGMFGLASGAQLFTTGAAGLSGLTTLLGGALEIIKDFSGAIALMPALISAAGISLGTLAVAFHGVGEAIGAIGDPAKFLEAIKDMGPITQQAMRSIQSFAEAFRGAREVVQESFFAQIVNDIEPLIRTWLPLLMNAGREVAGQFGQLFHEAFSVFQDPAIQQGFQAFIQNMSVGMQAARGAIRPFIEAWTTLSVVGSQAFQRLGVALTDVVSRFNAWIQRSAESGKLTEWINRALDAFTKMANVIENLGIAISNIFDAAKGSSGSFLDTVVRLSAEFRAWTESAKGQQTLVNFFELLKQAADAVTPIMKLLGESFSIVAGTLTRLGIAIGPGITSFFTSFRDALVELRPHILAIAPSLNELLTALGTTLLQVVQQLGPQLPKLFQGLADAFIALAPILPEVAHDIATVFEHLSPGDIQGILMAIIALKGLTVAFAGLIAVISINPIVLLIGAIAALVLGVIYAYEHSKTFRDAINGLWHDLQRFGSWIKNEFVNAIHKIGDAFDDIDITGWLTGVWDNISSWFENTDWAQLGRNLVNGILNGMWDMLGDVGDIADKIVQTVKDHLPQSRAKLGPFADASPEELGAKLAGDYAAGIASGSTGVSAASLSLASSASGIGTGGPSLGAPGGSGNRTFENSKSGFDQAVSFLTKDLSAWSSIIENAFNLFKDIGQIFIDTVRVTANLWNRGDNPITRPGGLMGPPGLPQQSIFGVPMKPIAGVAPDEYGRQLAAGAAPAQQAVPGVPSKPIPAGPTGVGPTSPPATVTGAAPPAPLPDVSGTAGTGRFSIPPAAPGAPPSATTTGAVTPGALPPAPSQQDIANYIINKALSEGYSREQANYFVTQAYGESTLRPGAYGAATGDYSGGASGIFQFTPGTWGTRPGSPLDPKRNIDEYFNLARERGLTPKTFTDPAQLGTQVSIGGPYHPSNVGHRGRAEAGAQPFIAGYGGPPPATTVGGASTAPGGGIGLPTPPAAYPQGPGGNVNVASLQGAGFPPLFQNPPGGESPNIPPWVQDFVKQYGGPSLVAASTPHGALHGRPGTAGYAVDVVGDPAEMDRLAKFLEEHPEASAMMIHQDVSGEPRGVLAGQTVAKGTVFTTPGGTYADEATMVHWAPSSGATAPPRLAPQVPPPVPTQAVSGIETPGLPRGPGGVTRGGLGLPSDAATYAIGGAAALAGGGAAFIGARKAFGAAFRILDIPANMRTAWLRSHFNELDARAKLDVIRSLTPQEIADSGIISPDQISFGEGARGSISGIGVDARGGPRPSAFAGLDLGEQRELGIAIQSVMGQPGGVTGYGPMGESGIPPARPPLTATGADVPSVAGDVGRGGISRGLSIAGRGLGAVASVAQGGLIGYGIVSGAVASAQQRDVERGRFWTTDGSVLGIPARNPSFAVDTGDAIGEFTPEERARYGLGPAPAPVVTAPEPAVGSAWRQYREGRPVTYNQPQAPPPRPVAPAPAVQPSLFGPAIQGPRAPEPPPGAGFFGPAASTPVHVTNPQQLPGGTQAPPVVQAPVKPAGIERPPRPGEPGFVGPVAPAAPAPVDQGPLPGAQRERRGVDPTLGRAAGAAEPIIQAPGDAGTPKAKADTRSPIDQFQDTLSSVGSIAGDAFKVFNDIIRNIGAAANITDLLVRGFANTEDVMFYINEMQTFLTTAADVAKLVGDVGSMVGGASGGMDMGAGAALSAIAGIVSSAIEATNAAIDLGQEVYHEVTKYAGFIIGSFLGGEATGPLGGNVRMLLNTATNELYTYSEDNPQNKNTFQVPISQQSYTQTAPPTTVQQQTNIYAGPGQTPRDMMNETMWLVGTGNASVASVSGYD